MPSTQRSRGSREELLSGVVLLAQLMVEDHGSNGRASVDEQWREHEVALRTRSDSPLARLTSRLKLNGFELKLLHLLLGMHCDPNMAQLIAQVENQPLSVGLTVRCVVRNLLSDARTRIDARRSFLPGSTLVDRHIITLGVLAGHTDDGLYDRPVFLTGPVVRYCLGEPAMPRLRTGLYTIERPAESLLDVVLPPGRVAQMHKLVAQYRDRRRCLAGVNKGRGTSTQRPRLLLSGPTGTGKTLLSRALASALGSPLLTLNGSQLPAREGLEEALRDALTDAWLTNAVLAVGSCDAILGRDDPRRELVLDALDTCDTLVVLHTNRAKDLSPSVEPRLTYHLTFSLPDAGLRQQLWEVHLPPDLPLADDLDVARLASLFDFTGASIRNAVQWTVAQVLADSSTESLITTALLEEACRAQLPATQGSLTLGDRTHHKLADIVLPDKPRRIVTDLLAACRNQSTVLLKWGFGRKLSTGKGIVGLFDGPPGTGKTFCAEIIASELERPLQRVNVAELVSKWVGETEKHVRQVFQGARIGHAVLLFDEADALFGARIAESKTAGDRQTNTVVNLLLQEIERFPGVCLLTTNFFGSLDKALVRRVQFRVTFETPNEKQRVELWNVLCPSEAPLDPGVDFGELASRFELTGAMIKNVLLRAAYRACDAGEAITMAHLGQSCIDEYAAAGRLVREN